MFKFISGKMQVLRILAGLFGISLLTYMINRIGMAKLLHDASKLGWGIGIVIALGGIAHLAKACSWRFALADERHKVPFLHFFKLRLASETVGQLGLLGQAAGEGLRVSALGSEVPIASRVCSVTIDRGLFVVTGALVVLVGLAAAPFTLNLARAWISYATILATGTLVLLLGLGLAVQKQLPIFSGSVVAAKKLRWCRAWLEKREHLAISIEKKLFNFHRDSPRVFWACLGLNLVAHFAALLEIFVVLLLLGFNIGILGALIFEALTKLVNVVGLVNPGNVGTYEGGNLLIAKMFRLGADTGLMVAVARRIRSIFWASIGALCLVALTKEKSRSSSQGSSESDRTEVEVQPAPAYHSIATPAKPTRVALILAGKPQDWYDIGPPLRGVGTLPVILRSILGIQRAGATRIIVCVHPADASTLRYTLAATDRLPRSVEWLEVAPSAGNLASILGQFAYEAEQERLLVIAADTAYYPGLLRDAMACDGSEAVAFTSGGVPIGIWSLPPAIAARIADQWEQAGGPDDIYPWLTEISSQRLEVQEDRWQPVITLADQVAAERKLNRWLTKPTDGIFAKLNRRISVPISRQLIKWPITPNMVSIFTLGVGFASGVYFAMGGYWNTLLAALLSLWASILDGCDGEVARLKLLESDFGCWLETVCDYLYYLFIFSGMAIGLIRTVGPKFVVWAALLLFGAIATFLVTGFGRHRLARGRPEQYLAIWQGQAEKRRENLILRLGRQTEFMIRRCFLPWAILGFAILGLTNAVLIAAAIGANCAWLISLYSYHTFAMRPMPSLEGSSARP